MTDIKPQRVRVGKHAGMFRQRIHGIMYYAKSPQDLAKLTTNVL